MAHTLSRVISFMQQVQGSGASLVFRTEDSSQEFEIKKIINVRELSEEGNDNIKTIIILTEKKS